MVHVFPATDLPDETENRCFTFLISSLQCEIWAKQAKENPTLK